jgi:hypothetical protein
VDLFATAVKVVNGMSSGTLTTELVLGIVGRGRLADGSKVLQDTAKITIQKQKNKVLLTGEKKVGTVIGFESSG